MEYVLLDHCSLHSSEDTCNFLTSISCEQRFCCYTGKMFATILRLKKELLFARNWWSSSSKRLVPKSLVNITTWQPFLLIISQFHHEQWYLLLCTLVTAIPATVFPLLAGTAATKLKIPHNNHLFYPQQLPGTDPTGVFTEEIKRRKTETDVAMQFLSPAINPVLSTLISWVPFNEIELDKLGHYLQNLPLLQACFADLSPEVLPG